MAVLAQYYNTGDDGFEQQYGDKDEAQTFTASQNYSLTSMKFLIYRIGTPGTVSLGLWTTDENGHPDVAIVGLGFNGNTLTTDPAGQWKEVTFFSAQAITTGTKYAIVISGGDDASNCVVWRKDGSSATFANGDRTGSVDNGVNWITHSGEDFMFELWTDFLFAPPSDKVTIRRLVAAAANKIWYENV